MTIRRLRTFLSAIFTLVIFVATLEATCLAANFIDLAVKESFSKLEKALEVKLSGVISEDVGGGFFKVKLTKIRGNISKGFPVNIYRRGDEFDKVGVATVVSCWKGICKIRLVDALEEVEIGYIVRTPEKLKIAPFIYNLDPKCEKIGKMVFKELVARLGSLENVEMVDPGYVEGIRLKAEVLEWSAEQLNAFLYKDLGIYLLMESNFEILSGKLFCNYVLSSVVGETTNISQVGVVYSTGGKSQEELIKTTVESEQFKKPEDRFKQLEEKIARLEAELKALKKGKHIYGEGRERRELGYRIQKRGEVEGEFFRSPLFYEEKKALSIGDVDGDGVKELVLAGPHRLLVYKLNFHDKVLGLKGFWVSRRYGDVEFINTSCADINQNGVDEIYVTGVRGNCVRSYVFEFDQGKGKFVKVAEFPYFVNVVAVGDRRCLLAQLMGLPIRPPFGGSEIGFEPFTKPMYMMFWDGKYRKKVFLKDFPSFMNIYNLSIYDVDGDEKDDIVSIDDSGYIEVLSGDTVIASDERFGGYINCFQFQNVPLSATEQTKNKYVCLPAKVFVLKDKEVPLLITYKNYSPVSYLLKGIKSTIFYSRGAVVGLYWDGAALAEAWKRKLQGAVLDIGVADVTGNNLPDLVILVARRTSTLKTKYRVIVYADIAGGKGD